MRAPVAFDKCPDEVLLIEIEALEGNLSHSGGFVEVASGCSGDFLASGGVFDADHDAGAGVVGEPLAGHLNRELVPRQRPFRLLFGRFRHFLSRLMEHPPAQGEDGRDEDQRFEQGREPEARFRGVRHGSGAVASSWSWGGSETIAYHTYKIAKI